MPHAVDWCCMRVSWEIYFDIWRLGVSTCLNINMSWVHSTSFTYCNQSLHLKRAAKQVKLPRSNPRWLVRLLHLWVVAGLVGVMCPRAVWFFCGRVAMEKMADSPAISVLTCSESELLQEVAACNSSVTCSLQLFCYVCCLHDIFLKFC